MLYKMIGQENLTNEDFEINFNRDKNFIAIEILKVDGASFKSVARRVKEDSLKPFNLTPGYIANVRSWQQFPTRNVALEKVEIKNSLEPCSRLHLRKKNPKIRLDIFARDRHNRRLFLQ